MICDYCHQEREPADLSPDHIENVCLWCAPDVPATEPHESSSHMGQLEPTE